MFLCDSIDLVYIGPVYIDTFQSLPS